MDIAAIDEPQDKPSLVDSGRLSKYARKLFRWFYTLRGVVWPRQVRTWTCIDNHAENLAVRVDR